MSELRNIIASALADRERTFGDAVVLLRTKSTFYAEIEPIQDIELNTELGRDPRESVTFHVLDQVAAASLQVNDTVTALGQKFKILRRSNNPINIQVDFGAMKITSQDQ